jgi:hypothetical protein
MQDWIKGDKVIKNCVGVKKDLCVWLHEKKQITSNILLQNEFLYCKGEERSVCDVLIFSLWCSWQLILTVIFLLWFKEPNLYVYWQKNVLCSLKIYEISITFSITQNSIILFIYMCLWATFYGPMGHSQAYYSV